MQDVTQDGLDQCFIRLRDEDIDEIVAQVPDDEKESCIKWAKTARAKASNNIERAPFDEVAEPPVL